MKSITTYLTFNGTCEAAFSLYAELFNGKIEYLGRYKDISPEARLNFPHCSDEQVMHATLRIQEDIVLMGSDMPDLSNMNGKNNFALYINAETVAEADRIFRHLSEEGNILVPIDTQFWGAYYGLCIDKYGIKWKVSWSADD